LNENATQRWERKVGAIDRNRLAENAHISGKIFQPDTKLAFSINDPATLLPAGRFR